MFVYTNIMFDCERLCEISRVRSPDSQTVESVFLKSLFVPVLVKIKPKT